MGLASDRTVPSRRSQHLASRSALVLAMFIFSPSLCLHRENRREPITHVIGNSTEGPRSRSSVSTCLCSAPGCQVTHDRWQAFCCLNFWIFFWYRCHYPHTSRYSVSDKCGIFFIYLIVLKEGDRTLTIISSLTKLDGIAPLFTDPSKYNSINRQNPLVQQNLCNFWTNYEIVIYF